MERTEYLISISSAPWQHARIPHGHLALSLWGSGLRPAKARSLSPIAETSAFQSCLAISTGPRPAFAIPSSVSLTSCSQIAQLQRCEPITEEEVKQLCLKAREILIEEGNVQVVDSPVTVRLFIVVIAS